MSRIKSLTRFVLFLLFVSLISYTIFIVYSNNDKEIIKKLDIVRITVNTIVQIEYKDDHIEYLFRDLHNRLVFTSMKKSLNQLKENDVIYGEIDFDDTQLYYIIKNPFREFIHKKHRKVK